MVPKRRKFDPQLDELLQRTLQAIRRSQELIAKTKELQQQSGRLKNEKYQPQTS